MRTAALHATPHGVLLAVAGPETGVEFLVAFPAGTAPGTAVVRYLGDAPPEVVVLVEGTGPGPVPFPGQPRVLPVPLAAAVLATGPAAPPGPVLVVDVPAGSRGCGARAWVVHGPDVTPVPLGGPAGTAGRVAGAARAAGVVEIVLAGGGATGPVFAIANPGAAPCPVRVAGPRSADDPAAVDGAGPHTAAVLGAALLGAALPGGAQPDVALPGAASAGPEEDREVPGPGPAATPAGGPARAGGRRWPIPAAASLGVALVAAGLLVAGPAPAPGAGPAAGAAGVVVQYGYTAALPAGWEHTGGDPARMRTLLTPAGRPDGADLIVVERSPLGYDAAREPGRAARELAAVLAGAPGVTGPEPRTVGGRAVLGYTQRDGATVTEWHVVLDGTDELVAGCRRPATVPEPGPACTAVVTSVRRSP